MSDEREQESEKEQEVDYGTELPDPQRVINSEDRSKKQQ